MIEDNDNLSVVNLFTEEECSRIIESIEDNSHKLKISDDNGELYLSSYEMQVDDLDDEVSKLILHRIESNTNLKISQKFLIKYHGDYNYMHGHYDCTDWSLPINLNNNFKGGETYLPIQKHKHIPQNHSVGSGLLFKALKFNSWHLALPNTEGVRYVLVIKLVVPRNFFQELINLLKLFVYTKFIKIFKLYTN